MLPAIQAARESARRTQCTNNLKQIALAVHSYQAAISNYPSFSVWNGVAGNKTNDISLFARILPYIEESGLAGALGSSSNEDQVLSDGTPLQAKRIAVYICPDEINDMVKLNSDGTLNAYPGNYGGNLGPWMVFDPTGKQKPLGSFFVNSRLKPAHFTDGLSKTLLASEIKAWAPYFSGSTAATSTLPTSTSAICPGRNSQGRTERHRQQGTHRVG